MAGMSGFEPEKKVLETSMIPFHHIPMRFSISVLVDFEYFKKLIIEDRLLAKFDFVVFGHLATILTELFERKFFLNLSSIFAF